MGAMSENRFQLFHRIADAGCARVRAVLAETGLGAATQYRNVDTGETARADLVKLLGRDEVPVLLPLAPGSRPIVGAAAVEAHLRSLGG
jgi:glutathione S-transferase